MHAVLDQIRSSLRRRRPRASRLEAELRRARPQASDELVARLVDAIEASAPRRFAPRRLAAGFVLTLVFVVAAGSLGGIGHAASAARKAVAAVVTAASPASSKVTICHATGSQSNPYTTVTVSSNGLDGHNRHGGDIVPAPSSGCPKAKKPKGGGGGGGNDDDDDDSSDDSDDPGEDQYKPGKGCGDKNHVHFKEGKCKKDKDEKEKKK